MNYAEPLRQAIHTIPHNLVVLGRDPDDMAIAANLLIESGGGMALVQMAKF